MSRAGNSLRRRWFHQMWDNLATDAVIDAELDEMESGSGGLTATGNGATDTAALQAAINDAITGGTPVVLAAGTFVITSTIDVQWSTADAPGFILRGSGMFQTTLRNEIPGGGPILRLSPTSDYLFQRGSLIEDIRFLGPTTETLSTQSGIEITSMNDFQINRCYFQDLGGAGIKVGTEVGDPNQTVYYQINSCHFDGCAHNDTYWACFLGYGATTGSSVNNCTATNCAGGFYSKFFGGEFNNCSANYCTQVPAFKTAYASGAGSRATAYNHCWVEGSHAGDFYVLGQFHRFIGNYHVTNQRNNYGVASISQSGSTTTLELTSPAFAWWMAGKDVTVAGATNGGNNDTFTIATVVDSKTITYSNASGVSEPTTAALVTVLPTAEHFYYELGRDDTTATVTSLTFDGTNTVTLVSPSSHFTYKDLGTAITISGASNSGNNGTFNITQVVSATTVKYANASGVTEGAVATYDFGTVADGRVAQECVIENCSGVSQGDVPTARGIVINTPAIGTQIRSFNFTQTTNMAVADRIIDNGKATEYRDQSGWLYVPTKKRVVLTGQYGSYEPDFSVYSRFRMTISSPQGLASITQSGGTNTIVADAEIFTSENVNGKTVWIDSASNSENNGKYTATYVNATTITVTNADGVTEDPTDATLTFGDFEIKKPINQPAGRFQGREIEFRLLNGSSHPVNLTWESGTDAFVTTNTGVDTLKPSGTAWFKFIFDDQSSGWVKVWPQNGDDRAPEWGSLRKQVTGSALSTVTTTDQVLNGTWETTGSSNAITTASPCKMTYSGGVTKKFRLSGHVTFNDPGTTARFVVLNILVNGTQYSNNARVVYHTEHTTEYFTLPYDFVVSLDHGDYVELAVKTLAGSLALDCYAGTMNLTEVRE